MTLLEENPDKIYWTELSRNTNDRAMTLLEENPDKICWSHLSSNTNDRAMTLLEETQIKYIGFLFQEIQILLKK
jgi:ribosomal protein L24E